MAAVAPPSLDLHVGYRVPRAGVPSSASFRTWVVATLAAARRRRASELSLLIVDEAQGRQLNLDYRGRDYATNVLSFPAELPPGIRAPLLGDIVICAPVVLREAGQHGKRPRDHYAHLTVHGVLHLLGHKHEAEDEAERMEMLETAILRGFGIADPYA